MRSFVIGALVVAVGVLGYLYWDSQYNTVFKAPGVEIKKNVVGARIAARGSQRPGSDEQGSQRCERRAVGRG